MKTNGVNEIDMDNWKDSTNVLTSSLWNFPERDNSLGKTDFYGGCIPQVFEQVITRFSKNNDLVVDLFAGGGTSGLVSRYNGRHWLGVEINPDTAEKTIDLIDNSDNPWQVITDVVIADSTSKIVNAAIQVNALHTGKIQADLVFLHPPYADIIDYGDQPGNLSHGDLCNFYTGMEKVAKNTWDITKSKGYVCLIIGDIYRKGALEPLSFVTMDILRQAGFTLKSHIVKNIAGNETGKGKNANLWRYRHLKNGTYDFSFENIFIFRKGVV